MNLDFKIPRFWVENANGNKHYPKEIKNLFSEDFDNYFIFHHPIYIDLDIENGLERSFDKYGRPKNKRTLTFDEFQKEFVKGDQKFKDYSEYVNYQNKVKDTRPKYLWGSENGSSIYMEDIEDLLKVLNPNLDSEVYLHYDILRKLDSNNENSPSLYLENLKDIQKVTSQFYNQAPEFILEKDKKWCLTTFYDDCKTAIGTDDETAERLLENKRIGVEKVDALHNLY